MKSHNLKAALAASALQNYQKTINHKPFVKKERSDLSMVMAYLTDPETRKQFNVSIEDLRNDKTSKIFKGKKYQELSDYEKQKVDQVIDGIRAKIFKAFACETPEAKAKLRSYLETNEPEGIIGKFLFGEEFKSQFSSKEEELKNQFAELEKKYSHGHKFEDFQKIHTAINFVDQVVEGNIQTETPERAYKAMAIFWERDISQTVRNINEFIKSFASKYRGPIHDMFMHELPKGINQGEWLKLIKKNGLEVLKELPRAQEIQQDEAALNDINRFRERVKALKYPRQHENPELAELYSHYEVDNQTFVRTLELIEEGQPLAKIKSQDNLPSVEHKLEGTPKNLWFMKLPAGDSRGLILGKITNCCQSINGNSEQCVIDGMTRPNNGFYVLVELPKGKEPKDIQWESFERDGNKILGQGYAWKSKSGNLSFDSWENLNPSANDIDVVRNLPAFTDKITQSDPNISRITLGLGGKTPKMLTDIVDSTASETMKEGFFYGDSFYQIEISESRALENLRNIVSIENPLSIIPIHSRARAELIISAEQAKFILEHKEIIKKTMLFHRWMFFPDSASLGNSHVQILFDEFTKDNNSLLVSDDANKAYKTKKVSAADLKDLEPDKIKLLISDMAREAYRTSQATAKDLKDLAPEKIQLLISEDARKAYTTGKISFPDLKDCDLKTIELLISNEALYYYHVGMRSEDVKHNYLQQYQKILKGFLSDITDENIDIKKAKLIASLPENSPVKATVTEAFKQYTEDKNKRELFGEIWKVVKSAFGIGEIKVLCDKIEAATKEMNHSTSKIFVEALKNKEPNASQATER